MNADGSVSNLQEGVFRTNCIDCLDRTNVVQSLIARQSLQDQLQVDFLCVYVGGWVVAVTHHFFASNTWMM